MRTSGTETSAQVSAVPTPTVADRITVSLVAHAAAALLRIKDRTRLSQTDVVNRAITMYDFVDSNLADGYEVILRDPKTGEESRVVFL